MPKPKSRRRGGTGPAPVPRRRKTDAPRANGRRRTKLSLAARKPGDSRVDRALVEQAPLDRKGPLSSRGKYVYCIINSEKPLRFGQIGIGGQPTEVYTIHYKNLAAVVSDAP